LVAAIAVFAITNGWSEYRIARSVRTSVVVNGVERDETPEELIVNFLIGDTVRAIPTGVVAVGLLCIPLTLVARLLRSVPRPVAHLEALAIGTVFGGFLSVLAWVLLGGWGPPFMLPSAAAGGVLCLAFVAASRVPI
jgi:hypothetical protein